MTFIEFVGFIITLVAMFFLVIKKKYEEWEQKTKPHDYATEDRMKRDTLKKLYRALEGNILEDDQDQDEEDHEEIRPVKVKKAPPKPPLVPSSVPIQKVVQTRVIPAKEKAPYQVNRDRRDSRGGRLIKSLTSKQEMVILREIFDKPLALRQPETWGPLNDRNTHE